MRRSRTVAAIALTLVAALAAGCQSQTPPQPDNLQPDPLEAAAETTTPTPTPEGPRAARFGVAEEWVPWVITVQRPGWSDQQLPSLTDKGFAWLVFQVTWEPLPTPDNAVPYATTPVFWVQADGGEEFTRNHGWQTSRQLMLTGLEPGERNSGLVSFVVPKGRGKLIVSNPEGISGQGTQLEWTYTAEGGPPADGSVAAKITGEDVAAHNADVDGRMLSWNELLADVPPSQRIPLARWDNYNLLNYLNTYLWHLPGEADGLQPYDGNELTAMGVLEDNPSALFPAGNDVGEQCELPSGGLTADRPEVYQGDVGDHTRFFWGFIQCPFRDGRRGEPGQRGTELVHLRIRFFRDSTGLDHAIIRVLKTPPLGERAVP